MKCQTRHRMVDAILCGLIMLAMAFFCAASSGCAAAGGGIQIKVPVPVECKEPTPERPDMPTDHLKPGGKTFDAVVAMQAEIEVREGYEGRLSTALKACQSPIKAAPAP